MSELFALKWGDVHFDRDEISVVRSVVMQVVGPCKTEAAQRPIPMDHHLGEALEVWRAQSPYRAGSDWVFASVESPGRWPYWGQPLMRKITDPVAVNLGSAAGYDGLCSVIHIRPCCARPALISR